MSDDQVSLGRFRVDLGRRELWCDGVPAQLGSRALDILCVLASAKGDVVTKDELMARVWPGRVVEESNILVHVSALRKALDEGKSGPTYLVTVPGRGYRLIGLQLPPPSGNGEVDIRQGLAFPDRPSIAVLPFTTITCAEWPTCIREAGRPSTRRCRSLPRQ